MDPGRSGPRSEAPMPNPLQLSLSLALSLAIAPALAQDAHHDHATGHDAVATMELATPAQPWATDAPLREGMREINDAVAALGHYEHGHMGPDQAVLLAGQVTDAIGGIVANCELEPEADAVLHVVLATLGQAATELKQDPTGHAPIATMRQALADYARLFDDSGFEAP